MQAWIEDPNKVPKQLKLGTEDQILVKWKELQTYHVPQHLVQDFHWSISTTCKGVCRPK